MPCTDFNFMTRPCALKTLTINVLAMFYREDVEPFRSRTAIQNTIRPHTVRPDSLALKLALQWYALKRLVSEMAQSLLHSFLSLGVKAMQILRLEG
jgi:hypothetical protein